MNPLLKGADDSFLYEKGLSASYIIRTNPSPEKFRIMCEGIKPYIDNKTNLIVVGPWNEIWEHRNDLLEPTEELGFVYLDIIREVYTNAPIEHEHDLPYGK